MIKYTISTEIILINIKYNLSNLFVMFIIQFGNRNYQTTNLNLNPARKVHGI